MGERQMVSPPLVRLVSTVPLRVAGPLMRSRLAAYQSRAGAGRPGLERIGLEMIPGVQIASGLVKREASKRGGRGCPHSG